MRSDRRRVAKMYTIRIRIYVYIASRIYLNSLQFKIARDPFPNNRPQSFWSIVKRFEDNSKSQQFSPWYLIRSFVATKFESVAVKLFYIQCARVGVSTLPFVLSWIIKSFTLTFHLFLFLYSIYYMYILRKYSNSNNQKNRIYERDLFEILQRARVFYKIIQQVESKQWFILDFTTSTLWAELDVSQDNQTNEI